MKKAVSKASRMLHNARLRKGWTQQELGTMLGHKYGNFIGMMENSASQIPIDMIPTLCELLGIDTKKFLKEVMICRHPGVAKYM